ncbi:nuclear transport factor 2 family protein [Paraburkholderia sp. Ac-20342]|uniref:nuclear transport factor 2 family protein n=1 Tax=Paraburkholderia sp. Ac-20342 TaxID=2703889 RepID=UPI00198136CA|nr:nuclear transport factor 2 family protein [Paraburkholderia sp. Ac-20342]MBN3846819.1 nuclear transport factor 2 family protein [Paraburkholderia sp. Ac-20342]
MQAHPNARAVDNSHFDILRKLQVYLDAIYSGDVAALQSTFHPASLLFAEVRGEIVQKTLNVYLQGVRSRQSPASLNEPYGMSVLGVEVVGNMASAKVRVKMSGNNYYDFLSLLKVDGRWLIVNKLYTHIDE